MNSGQRRLLGKYWHVGKQLSVLSLLVLASGCAREYYRRSADQEADHIVAEKNVDPRWKLNDLSIYPDERSRFFDPYPIDRPPMPLDDPASHQFMHCVDGIRGYRHWYRDGSTALVVNPHWHDLLPQYTQCTDKNKLLLDLPTAALLARLNNDEYQTNLENIYLSALDVAFERFRFDVQFFAGNSVNFTAVGNEVAALGATGPASRNSSSIVDLRSTASFSRAFASGGQLLAGIANSIVWQFSGPNTNYTTSILDFSLVQPLLRRGGKPLVLETLTRAERNLLAGLRAQAQFRQAFYKDIAIGGGNGRGPQRIGGFTGGAGLTGFTGVGTGGFGGVGQGQGFGTFGGETTTGGSGAGGGAGLAGGGEGIIGGFYGLVQRLQTIRNTEASLASQNLALQLLEANFEAGLIQLVQVDEFRQNIETERARLLQSRTNFQDQLEQYLVEIIGLPPWLDIELDTTIIDPYVLISQPAIELQNRGNALLARFGEQVDQITRDILLELNQQLIQILTDANSQADAVAQQYESLTEQLDRRLEQMASEAEKEEFRTSVANLRGVLEDVQQTLTNYLTSSERIRQELPTTDSLKVAIERLVELTRATTNELQELALIQARIKVESITVDPVELSFEDAFLIAMDYRLDWMNARAALVDQWRLITFNADRLEAILDIELNGSIGTVGDNPISFRGSTGVFQARLVFDAPITRKSERNQYRQSLIDYQRAKRDYIIFVDTISLTLRSRLRLLQRLKENLEIQRRALVIAIRRVDQTLEALNEPPPLPAPGESLTQLGPTLAQNLLQAISDLRNVQDNFLSVYLNYQASRFDLMFDLGIVQIDERGQWRDESIETTLAKLQAEYLNCPREERVLFFPEELQHLGIDTIVLPEHHEPVALTEFTALAEEPIQQTAATEAPSGPENGVQAASDGAIGAKTAPTANRQRWWTWWRTPKTPNPGQSELQVMTQDAYYNYLQQVQQLHAAGLAEAQIAQETHLSIPQIRAFLQALNRSQEPVARKIIPDPPSNVMSD